MKISEKIKRLFRRRRLTPEQLAARAEADARTSIERGNAEVATEASQFTVPPGI